MDDSTMTIIEVALAILLFVSCWIVLNKADQPGWSIFVPIYNGYCALQVAGMSGWWLLALVIPGLNIVALFLMALGTAGHFGKGFLFALGLFFLPVIFIPILAFTGCEWS